MNALSSPLDRAFFCALKAPRSEVRPARRLPHPEALKKAPPGCRSKPPLPTPPARGTDPCTERHAPPQMRPSSLSLSSRGKTPPSGRYALSPSSLFNILFYESQALPTGVRPSSVLPVRRPERSVLFHGHNRKIPFQRRSASDLVSPCKATFTAPFQPKGSFSASRARAKHGRTYGNPAALKTFRDIESCV